VVAPEESLPPDSPVSEPEPAGLADESTPPPKRPKRRRRLVIGALALFAFIALALPVFSTLQPGYYGRYPDLRVRMDHWRTSTHARTSCIACHVNPGVRGFATFAVRSIPVFYSQMVNGPTKTDLFGAPDKAACQRCHTDYRQVSPAGDLLIPHRAHVEVLGVNCVVCHKSLVHSPNKQGFNRPEMETCLECHDGDKASNKCTDCHTRKNAPDTHTAKNWLAVHGSKAETTDCGACHSWTPDYCDDCHKKRPASHAGNWKKDHGPHAEKRGKGCLVCHGEAFCKECH